MCTRRSESLRTAPIQSDGHGPRLTAGSSHNQPRPHPAGRRHHCGSQDTSQAMLPSGQGASGPQSSPQEGAPADSLLVGVCSPSAQRERKTRGRTSSTSSRPTPRDWQEAHTGGNPVHHPAQRPQKVNRRMMAKT